MTWLSLSELKVEKTARQMNNDFFNTWRTSPLRRALTDVTRTSKFLRSSALLSFRNVTQRHEVRSSARRTSPLTMVNDAPRKLSFLLCIEDRCFASQSSDLNGLTFD